MNIRLFLVLCLAFAFIRDAVAQTPLIQGEALTIHRGIEIALANHPDLAAAQGSVRAAESRIGQARAGWLPNLSLQSGYTRVAPPDASLRSDPYNYYANSLNLNQTLFDFGKTSTRVDITSLQRDSADADFRDTAALVTLGVQHAYFSLLRAIRMEAVAAETVDLFFKHYDMARAFFETGRTAKIDVTSAEVNLSNARIQLLSAQNHRRVARATLNRAMGLTDAPDYTIVDDFADSHEALALDDALLAAYEKRPDLQAFVFRREAVARHVDLARKDFFPVFSGGASYGYAGRDSVSLLQSWNLGVTLSIPLFSGFATRHSVSEAKATLDVALANEEALRQSIHLEVQSAWLNRQEAYERIEAGRTIVRQAEETLELAQGRYTTGVGSSIEITDAMIQLNNAKMTLISALSDFSIAQASLQKAIGATP